MEKQAKLHVRTGDTVLVISGSAKGKTGVIKSVDRKEQRAIVGEVNYVKRHVKPSAGNPQGEIVEKEAPIHVSNLKVVDPKTGEASRTGRKANKDGKLQRFSKKSGNFI